MRGPLRKISRKRSAQLSTVARPTCSTLKKKIYRPKLHMGLTRLAYMRLMFRGSPVENGNGLNAQMTNLVIWGFSLICQDLNKVAHGLKWTGRMITTSRREETVHALRSKMWMGIWWRLELNPAAPNEHIKLELPGAWELNGSSCSSPLGEGSRAQSFVFNGDKTR